MKQTIPVMHCHLLCIGSHLQFWGKKKFLYLARLNKCLHTFLADTAVLHSSVISP